MKIRNVGWWITLGPALVFGCGGSNDAKGEVAGQGGASGGRDQGNGSGGSKMDLQLSGGRDGSVVGIAGGSSACSTSTQTTTLRTPHLAFMFDASGSMGELDYPWHDPALKWEPVVAATRSFFENSDSADIYAAMTLFPVEGDRCNAEQYSEFDVPMTPLPSSDFGDLLGETAPDRGGTPTLAVIQGTLGQIQAQSEDDDSIQFVMVLVTDGTPQGCDDNTLESIESAVGAVSDTIPTYVIGVENPPLDGAPENVSGLNSIAQAGGTEAAFIIETGEPELTTRAFLVAIEAIRDSTISCDVAIPSAPRGQVLNPRRVNVRYTIASEERLLNYDPDCVSDEAWHYDDANDPSRIRLCSKLCDDVRSEPSAQLSVQFACEDVITVL